MRGQQSLGRAQILDKDCKIAILPKTQPQGTNYPHG